MGKKIVILNGSPNRFRDIGGVVGVDYGGVASAGNSGGAAEPSSGHIPAWEGENPDADGFGRDGLQRGKF